MSIKSFTGNGNSSSAKIVEPYMSIAAQDIVADNCRHSGYIRKEGDRIKTWNNRYTVLHKGCIYYYASAEDSSARGEFSLNGYSLSAAPEKCKHKWTFKLVNIQPEKRTYYFAAHSEREMVEWMNMIQKEIDEINGISRTEEDLAEYHYPEVPVLNPITAPPVFKPRSPSTLSSSSDLPEYCPPPDVSLARSPKQRPRAPSPPTSRRPASIAEMPVGIHPLLRSQSAQSVFKLPKSSKPLPVPRMKKPLECEEEDWYDNDEDTQSSPSKTIDKSRIGVKMSVGSLGLEERHLHQSPAFAQAARLIEPIHPAPTKAERLTGSTAIPHQKPFSPPSGNKDHSTKFSKSSKVAKPQISLPLPYPRPATPPCPPRKPAVSPKPSVPISLPKKTFTGPQGFGNREVARDIKERISKTLPPQNKSNVSDDSDEEYLKVVPESCPENNNLLNKKSTLERRRPEGMSTKNQVAERSNLLPPSAERLDLDKTTALLLFVDRKDGFYLIHSSRSAETKKALSVWTLDKVRHFLIFLDKVEGYALDPTGPRFDSIPNLLDYYYRNYLPRCSTRLTEPYMGR